MKKMFSLALLLVILVTACASAPSPTAPTVAPATAALATAAPATAAPATAAPAATTQPTVTLQLAIWDTTQQAFTQQSIDAFEQQYPNIKVNIDLFDQNTFFQKLSATVAGQESYDTFWMDAYNFTNYAKLGAMLDLSPYIKADNIDMNGLYGATRAGEVVYNGDSYAMPKDVDDPAVYYNKDLFDKYGVAYPTAGWTWDDFKAMATKLNHPADGVWGYTTGQLFGGADWWNWVWENGGNFLNSDGTQATLEQPAACDAIKYWYTMMNSGLAPDGNTLTASDPTTTLFPQGKVAMIYYGQWMLEPFSKLPFRLGVAPVPAGPAGNALEEGGLNYAVWSGTKHPQEAWEFVKFMSGQQAMDIQAKAGVIIPALTSAQSTWAKVYPNLDLQTAYLDMLPYGRRPLFVGWDWNNAINKVLTDVWSGNIPIDQACKAADDAANAVLSKQ